MSTPNIAQINMDNLVLLSDRSLCIIFSTGAYRRDSVIVNVQVNWPKLFQDFSVKFTLIVACMRSFNNSSYISTCKKYA